MRALPKVAESFYQSKEWRALVRSIKAARGKCCARCGSGHRVIGGHIVERKDGGAGEEGGGEAESSEGRGAPHTIIEDKGGASSYILEIVAGISMCHTFRGFFLV